MIATTVQIALVFLSRFLFESMRITSGTNATTQTITPMLFHSQNFVGLASDAGSMWLAFFQSCAPTITHARSSTIRTIRSGICGKNVRLILPKATSTASTSNKIASAQRTTAPMRRPLALPTSAAGFTVWVCGLGAAPGLTSAPVSAEMMVCCFFSAIAFSFFLELLPRVLYILLPKRPRRNCFLRKAFCRFLLTAGAKASKIKATVSARI